MDIEELAIETSIDRLKARPAFIVPLSAALDNWVDARRLVSDKDTAGWKRLVAVARGIDPEPLRDRLRSTWGQPVSETQDELRRLAETIDVRAHHPATLLTLARGLQRVGLSDSALRLLQDAQVIYPGDFWLNFDLGSLLRIQKNHGGAIRFYTAAVAIRPDLPAAHTNLGVVLKENGKPKEAISVFRGALRLDPGDPLTYSGLGTALAHDGRPDEAIAAHREAIRLEPEYATAHYNLSFPLKTKGKLDEAVAALREAIRLKPDFFSAHGHLGDALYAQGNWAGAFASFEEVVRLKPDHHHWTPKLAVLLATCPEPKLRDTQRALGVATKFAELVPRDTNAWQVLGWVRYCAGDFKGSIEALERSCKLQEGGAGDGAQWIVLALAHARLATQQGMPEKERERHKAESRRDYERGIKQIDGWWRVRPDHYWYGTIWDFGVEARKRIGAEVEKK